MAATTVLGTTIMAQISSVPTTVKLDSAGLEPQSGAQLSGNRYQALIFLAGLLYG